MKRTIVLLAAVAVGGCSATPHRIVELPTGEPIHLVPTFEGDEAVEIPCEWWQEPVCRRRMRDICGSDYTALFFDVGVLVARCWNHHLPWVQESGIYACSNGGTTTNDVRVERQANGADIVFARRARVAAVLNVYADNDPAFQYLLTDDWAIALCWGGVWRVDNNVDSFLRYLRDQGAAIDRIDDGAVRIHRARP